MRGLYNGKAPSVTWGSWHLEGIFRNAKIQINFILAKFFSYGSFYLLPAYGARNLVNLVNFPHCCACGADAVLGLLLASLAMIVSSAGASLGVDHELH